MKPELTLKQSESDIQNIARRLEQEYPATNANFNARALPPVDAFSGGSALILIAVLGLVAVLLMAIACANVASLLLAWAAARQREFLVRIALGSGRWRLLKDLMMEHFVLSLMAGAAGLVLSHWGLQIVRTIAGETSPIFAEMIINQRVLLFTLLLSLVTPLLFGVAPLLRSVRSDLTEGLKDGVRSLGAGVRGRFVRGSLVVCQIGLALTLLIGVGLLVRTMLVIQALEKGLNPENLLTFRVDLPERRYSEQNQIRTFYENLIAGIEGLPGVESAGMINRLPFAERELIENFHIDGRPAQADQPFWAARAVVTDRYRQTGEVRLIKGRDFAPADSQSAPAVALISEFAAQRYWPNEDPIGKRVRFDRPGADSSWIEIVGIVNDVRNSDPDAGLIPQIYVPYSQNPVPAVAVLVRATSNPAALTPAIRAVASGLDSNQAIYDVATMNRVIYDDTANDVILLGILVALSAIALGLAASGVYAVTAYSVARRTSEIGLRMALGAQTSTVLRMVLRQNLTLVVIGALVGLSGGLAFGQLTSSFLYQVSPTDSVTFTSMTSVVFIAAFLGCYLPARRAMRIDPISALSLKNM